MGALITICGIDGSGKTTQLNLLAEYIRDKDVKFKCVWFRWQAFLSYPFLALCRLLGYTKWKTIQSSGVRYAERRFHLNKAIMRLWPWIFALDTFLHSINRVKIPASLGYTILCDRFIPDILVDLMYETKNYKLTECLAGRLLLSVIPKDSKLILIDIIEDMAFTRKHDIPSVDYLGERRRLYLALARRLSMPVIHGEGAVNRINKNIMRVLELH